jgi:hypothetical protein
MKRVAVAVIAATSLMFVNSTFVEAGSTTLTSKLLTIGQMPTGWSVTSTPSSGGVGCLSNILNPKGVHQTSAAAVSFQGSGGLPTVEEKLATYSQSATSAFDKVVSALNACRSFTGESDGQKVTGKIGQMSFPSYGNQSEAFAITFADAGQTLHQDALISRSGSIIMGLSEGDTGTVNLAQFEGFAKLALERLGAHTTSSSSATATTTTAPTSATKSTSTLSFSNADGEAYSVVLKQVIDPAKSSSQYTSPNTGDRFVAAVFTITDTGKQQISDDANSDVSLVGSNNQTYAADFVALVGCTNFDEGEFQLNPGQSTTGCVAFQVPNAVATSKIEWSPSGGSGGGFGTWNLK